MKRLDLYWHRENEMSVYGGSMKPPLTLSLFILVFLFSAPFVSTAIIAAESQTTATTTNQKKATKGNKPYSGYSVDGRTSASILSAKRSHEVAKEDEMGLAIFSGLIVIAVIGFLTHLFFEKK
jgi:hypothetical protein